MWFPGTRLIDLLNRKVSIIIPSFNCGRFICEAIESVMNQAYKNIEIIVVDDGSTDNTTEVLRPYIRKGIIRYFLQNNKGPAAARNKGIIKSRGRYIAFLDADDLWGKEKLKKSISFMVENSFDWMCTSMIKIGFDGKQKIKSIPDDSWVLNSATKEIKQLKKGLFFFSSIPVHTPTIIARKECFERAGLFDESFMIGEDTDLWLRFEEAGLRGGYLGDTLTIYRYNKKSITRGRIIDGLKEHIKVARKHLEIMGPKDEFIRKSFAKFLWQVADSYISQRNYFKAAKCVCNSLIYDPDNANKILRKILRLS